VNKKPEIFLQVFIPKKILGFLFAGEAGAAVRHFPRPKGGVSGVPPRLTKNACYFAYF
jgi:hypothetical protein